MKGLIFTTLILLTFQMSFSQKTIFENDFSFEKNDTLVIRYKNTKEPEKFLGFESHFLVAPNSLLFVEPRSSVLAEKDIEYFYKTDETPFSFNIYWVDEKAEGITLADSLNYIVDLVFVATTDIPSINSILSYDDQRDNQYTYAVGTNYKVVDLDLVSEVIDGPDNVSITYITSERAEFLSKKRQTLHFVVSDILGRQIYQTTMEVNVGPVNFEMPRNLPENQNLILSVSNGKEVFARKFYSSRQ